MLPVSTIRELCLEQELPMYVDLLRAAFGTVAKDFGLTEASAPTNAAFTTLENLRLHLNNGLQLFGLFRDGLLVGCVATKASKADKAVFYIERLAVAPDERHRGYGGQLLSFAMENSRASGGKTASIGLIDSNQILKEWYQSKGFAQHDCRSIPHLPFRVCFMSINLALPESERRISR